MLGIDDLVKNRLLLQAIDTAVAKRDQSLKKARSSPSGAVISAPRRLLAWAIAFLLLPAWAAAQAFTPPARVGSVTLGWQWVENTGHVLTDGTFLPLGQSVTTSLLVEVDYGVTERFAATASVPFVFARYTGGLPPRSGLELDACRCWNESFQDFSIAGRYRFGDDFWAITPQVRYIQPSHNYQYQGEAVVGPNLQQLALGHQRSLAACAGAAEGEHPGRLYVRARRDRLKTSGRTEAT